jgi:hypothetical protein
MYELSKKLFVRKKGPKGALFKGCLRHEKIPVLLGCLHVDFSTNIGRSKKVKFGVQKKDALKN